MGLLSGLLTLPLAPVRGVTWVAEQVRQQAERQYYDPASIRRQLTEIDDAHAAGEVTDQERDELQEELLGLLFEARRRREQGKM